MAQDSIKRLYVQNVDDWEKKLSAGKFSDRELGFKVLERGIILPARLRGVGLGYEGGVCDNDFNFVAGYTRVDPAKRKRASWTDVDSAYEVAREDIIQLDEDVIFGGTMDGHFGHFLMENFSCRLWYVVQHPELNLKVLFVPSSHGGYRPWFDEFFRLMGIAPERIVYVNQPIQCRSIIIPDQSQYWTSFTKEWVLPFQAIQAHVKPGNVKKLYLTRTNLDAKGLSKERVFNEEYFEDFFAARGFKVISMEKLALEEQISLVMGADELAATLGTLTHWALFCKPTAKFTMLLRAKNDDGRFQRIVNNVFKNYYIVNVTKNFMYATQSHSTCLIGSTKHWKAFVADYFGEQIGEDDDNPYLNMVLDKYIDFWCRIYVGKESENFDIILGSLRNMCTRIVALEQGKILNRPLLTYQTHVSKDGWVTWKSENQFSNPIDQQRDIQAVKINFAQPFHDVFYSVYYGDSAGWSQEVSNGSQAGTTGLKKSIFGIKIRLDDSGANEFDILYRVHTFDGVWSPWAKNGELLYAHEVKLNALQIKLQSK